VKLPESVERQKIDQPKPVYRVRYKGTDHNAASEKRLADTGIQWEGVRFDELGVGRHSALVEADNEQHAAETVRLALADAPEFTNFEADALYDAQGAVRRGQSARDWDAIEWGTPPLEALTPDQRSALQALRFADEPTWVVARRFEQDRARAAAALRELRARGLVESRHAPGFEPQHEDRDEDWWWISDRGWDRLGLIKRPGYPAGSLQNDEQ
jgi:hypothetical protein